MKRKTVSIKNIADELKISVTTVSFVLNEKKRNAYLKRNDPKSFELC